MSKFSVSQEKSKNKERFSNKTKSNSYPSLAALTLLENDQPPPLFELGQTEEPLTYFFSFSYRQTEIPGSKNELEPVNNINYETQTFSGAVVNPEPYDVVWMPYDSYQIQIFTHPDDQE
jgi:hypothetical protein